MVKKMAQFQTLTGKREKVNPKLTAIKVELAHVEDEIEKLLNTLTGASAVLISKTIEWQKLKRMAPMLCLMRIISRAANTVPQSLQCFYQTTSVPSGQLCSVYQGLFPV